MCQPWPPRLVSRAKRTLLDASRVRRLARAACRWRREALRADGVLRSAREMAHPGLPPRSGVSTPHGPRAQKTACGVRPLPPTPQFGFNRSGQNFVSRPKPLMGGRFKNKIVLMIMAESVQGHLSNTSGNRGPPPECKFPLLGKLVCHLSIRKDRKHTGDRPDPPKWAYHQEFCGFHASRILWPPVLSGD